MDAPRDILRRRLEALPGWRAGLILDVRPAAAFAAGRLRGAVSLPLEPCAPDDGLFAGRLPSILLPPRHAPLLVVAGDPDVAAALAAHLAARGRAAVDALAVDAADLAALPPELTARGPARGHLWRPPAWLARHEGLLPPPALGPALDLACGSGRACVWLAARGWRVTGLDHQPEALALGESLAARHGVRCRFAAADLRAAGALPPGPWALVTAFRFLHRPLLEGMARAVAPGGVVCLRTFRDPPGYAGHPRPRHRLARGELLALFPRGPWEILAHEEGHDADGLPAAGLVARRRRDDATSGG